MDLTSQVPSRGTSPNVTGLVPIVGEKPLGSVAEAEAEAEAEEQEEGSVL